MSAHSKTQIRAHTSTPWQDDAPQVLPLSTMDDTTSDVVYSSTSRRRGAVQPYQDDQRSSAMKNGKTGNARSAVSLFSGAGGMDVGFAAAGYDVVLANDLDRDACQTYRLNHGDHIIEGNLTHHLQSLAQHKGVDLVFGGPPCQGFSVAGKMDPEDERSELLHTFFDVVDALEPEAFVCENVKALALLNRWLGVREAIFKRAREQYHVTMVVLSADHYGVPQKRERVFYIGIKKRATEISSEYFEKVTRSLLHEQKRRAQTVAQVIRSMGRAGTEGNEHLCNAVITFAKNPVLRRSAYAGMLFNGAGRPINPHGYAPTLPASMGGNKTPIVDEDQVFSGKPSFIEQYHSHLMAGGTPRVGLAPERLRRLTVEECLAFQTFPIDYRLHGKQSAKYRQIGNAVPCVLAEAVARVVDAMAANLHVPGWVDYQLSKYEAAA